MPAKPHSFDKARCHHIVQQYLQRHNWQLIDSHSLAGHIWEDASAENLSGEAAVEFTQTQVWQRYAVLLHDLCRQNESNLHERAWDELSAWLSEQAHRFTPNSDERNTLVQETAADLYRHLEKSPLKSPRAFLAYALSTLRRKNIDLHRRETAIKRGSNDALYLEEMETGHADEDKPHWEDTISDAENRVQSTEQAFVTKEFRQKIQAFLREHLATDLQIQVTEAHFLDGLTPKEIAQLMGKKPHEIRMAKARAVQALRSLPPGARQELLRLISPPDEFASEVDHE